MPISAYEKIAQVFKIIAHPCRLRIIDLLKKAELSASQIQVKVDCKQSVTSQHLNKMKNGGILQSRRCRNEVFYSIANFEVLRIMKCFKDCPHSERRDRCLKS